MSATSSSHKDNFLKFFSIALKMLALSPSFPAFGFPLEDDHLAYEQNWEPDEALFNFNSDVFRRFDSFGSSSSPIENELHIQQNSGETSSDPPSTKKYCHNASERERRKKMNDLYSTLRSMLPNTDQNKKLSIPSTISHALKYIPQLQNEVERLVQRKEEILSSISKQSDDFTNKQKKGLKEKSMPAVSTSQIGDKEIVIQICASVNMKKIPFSQVLQNLEEEHLQIHNASSFVSGDNTAFYTLHAQVKEKQRMKCQRLSEKISSLC